MNEQLVNRRKRLIFRSWHRGTREMDLLMGTFADENLPHFSDEECAQYEAILEYSDPDLYNWYTGKEDVPANLITPVLDKFIAHQFNPAH
ncbi:MAG: succinate dehydrogenase assembly factor 2 [Alphaproteobacteria bacterium]|nr:succinate dehydrogenase assembly factor 2 [Alphaproteobacteria bacterium]MDP7222033.1 succinate dehydrogenase assembly factor 2 [Alphaproteobacteria bacterium]